MAEQMGVSVEAPFIVNPYPFKEGSQNISWTYDQESLGELANLVVETIRKDYDKGGLWNPDTGRFAWAI